MKSLKDKVELTANLCIIVVAVLLCVVLIKSYIISPPARDAAAAAPAEARKVIRRGESVALPGVDWEKNGKTLLLALSTTCHFCTQSGTFYQRLVKENGGAKLVALVPQEADEGRAYLRSLGVEIGNVMQVSLRRMGLNGTPTLVLVDDEGVVTDIWVGALLGDQENEVISRLRPEQASK